MDRRVLFFHSRDNDGFGCYWAAKYHEDMPTEYIPYDYGQEIELGPLVDKHVVFCDVTPEDRETMHHIAKICASLVVIDHHGNAYNKFKDIPDEYVFSNEHSAAVLTWNYFGNDPAPALLEYVEDRDLWKWELPNSKEINYGLDTLQQTFEAWNYAAQNIDVVGFRGEAVLSYMNMIVERSVETSYIDFWADWNVAMTNASACWSEVGHALLEKYGDEVDFAVTWYIAGPNTAKFSLRSEGDFDVSAVARLFGGNGHKNAAGFILDIIDAGDVFHALRPILYGEEVILS